MKNLNTLTDYEITKYYTNKYYLNFKHILSYNEIFNEIYIIILEGKNTKSYKLNKSAYIKKHILLLKNKYMKEHKSTLYLEDLKIELTDNYSLENYMENIDLQIIFKNILYTIRPRDLAVLKYYYGFYTTKYTVKELSKKYKVCSYRILQLKNRAIKQIQHPARSYKFIEYINPKFYTKKNNKV